MLSLHYSVRGLSNGAKALLVFPADRRAEASRELTDGTRALPGAFWAVSLLLPGGVRLSLPPAALERALPRLPEEGVAALLDCAQQEGDGPRIVLWAEDDVRAVVRALENAL